MNPVNFDKSITEPAFPIYVQGRRFAATLGELTGGRVGLTCGSVGVLKGAVTIAVRYSAGRQQFGPPDSPEVCVYVCVCLCHLLLQRVCGVVQRGGAYQHSRPAHAHIEDAPGCFSSNATHHPW